MGDQRSAVEGRPAVEAVEGKEKCVCVCVGRYRRMSRYNGMVIG